MLQKTLALAAGAVQDVDTRQGIVCGYYSRFGNRDAANEVVQRGAYSKSLREHGPSAARPRIKHLWQHDMEALLGMPRVLEERDFGLYFETKIVPTTLGRDVLLLYEADVLEHSVGYQVVRSRMDHKEGVRYLEEMRLVEGSSVTLGCNPDTPLVGIKTLPGDGQSAETAWLAALVEHMHRVERLLRTSIQTEAVGAALTKHLAEARTWLPEVPVPARPYVLTDDASSETASSERETPMTVGPSTVAQMVPVSSESLMDHDAAPPKRAPGARKKARDFSTLFQALAEGDDLQDEWGDAFQALVQAFSDLMSYSRAQDEGWLPADAVPLDVEAATQANLDAFGTVVRDLVSRSVALGFVPMLDDDGDAFLDPDGIHAADGEEASFMRHPDRALGQKRGAVMSGANHKALGALVTAAETLHTDLRAFHGRMAPAADDAASDVTPPAKRWSPPAAPVSPPSSSPTPASAADDPDVQRVYAAIQAARAPQTSSSLAAR